MKSEIITNYLIYNLGSNKFKHKVTNHPTTLQFSHMLCDGRNCNNIAIYCLVIIYFNKLTYFCERCINDMEEDRRIKCIHHSNSEFQNMPGIIGES
ncbi:MAG TPA: hypothetical protein VN704_13265 [Verrucomicrobiae bacterium]|nr:hypothetical protein [Verrucomicrobiae bacterium]